MAHDTIIILDFGSQYGELIARRVRECQVYSEVKPHDISQEEISALKPKGIILSGGPASVYEKGAPLPDPKLWDLGIPILGICYGLQLMASQLGGKVVPDVGREYGKAELNIEDSKHLFAGLPSKMQCWMSHGDRVETIPPSFQILARTGKTQAAAIGSPEKRMYGLQFHPEVFHTPQGLDLIKNFLYMICDCKPTWTTESFIEHATQEIRETVGKERVLCALSGGVDSTTVSALVHQAVGDQLTCMFIDQGFMRREEPKRIADLFTKYFKINLVYVDASDHFFEKLEGVTDPEEKRHRIGNEFIRTFEKEAKKLGEIPFLAQGTLYPDVIESAVPGKTATTAVRIKTHHNVGGLPKDISFKLIEPLKRLFKDEVRKLGQALGVPDEIVLRQPFPGPGLAIRIIGEVTRERVSILQHADWILMDEIKSAGLYQHLWQSFVVLLPIRTVGVMGDKRTYLNTVAIRAVTATDGMTADWARVPYDVLEKISSRIVNEVPEINRVVYDISSKPPATIEWE